MSDGITGAQPAQAKCKCGWLLPQFEIEVDAPESLHQATQPQFTFRVNLTCPKCKRAIGLAGQN